jgi:hypothetical protein
MAPFQERVKEPIRESFHSVETMEEETTEDLLDGGRRDERKGFSHNNFYFSGKF